MLLIGRTAEHLEHKRLGLTTFGQADEEGVLTIDVVAIEIRHRCLHGQCSCHASQSCVQVTRAKSSPTASQNALSSPPDENAMPSSRSLSVAASARNLSPSVCVA